MVAMPYILVNIVFSIFNPLFFLVMSVLLVHVKLKEYSRTSNNVKNNRWKYFTILSISIILIISGAFYGFRGSNNFFLFTESCLISGFVLSVYILYSYIKNKYFKKISGLKRESITLVISLFIPFVMLSLFSIIITAIFIIK